MNKVCFMLFCCLLLPCFFAKSGAQTLKRKALPRMQLSKTDTLAGAVVNAITPGSAVAGAGIVKGDRILSINGVVLSDAVVLANSLRKLRGGDTVRLQVQRAGTAHPLAISFVPQPAPLETFANLNLERIAITNKYGDVLQAYLTKPKNATGRLPAILFVSWLSCATIELTDLTDNWTKMLRTVAEQSGAVFLRLEKPGVGDSEGIACSDCELQRELNGYEAALRYLKSRADVDTSRLLIFGASLGGSLGPLVGRGHHIKAYVSAVSVYKTWLEHMIELERRRMALSGRSQAEASELMPGYVDFYRAYLHERQTPAAVIKKNPQLGSLWYDAPAHQYGRPAAFYHHVADQNFFAAWASVTAPVLVVAGEHDWIMTLDDSHLLRDELNSIHPGQVSLIVGKGMDHHWTKYGSAKAAFEEKGGVYDEATVALMVDWIKNALQ